MLETLNLAQKQKLAIKIKPINLFKDKLDAKKFKTTSETKVGH